MTNEPKKAEGVKQIDLQLTGGNNNGNRRELDFYPTPANVTIALLDFLNIPLNRTIWEPACGDGAMSKVMEARGYKVYSSDIAKNCYGVGESDFLDCSIKADAIITNPPFNLSEEFIKKAVSECRLVAFLLKSQYWHAGKRFKLFNDFTPTYVLPLTWRPDFLEHERLPGGKKGAPTMEVAWTVWDRSSNKTPQYRPLSKP